MLPWTFLQISLCEHESFSKVGHCRVTRKKKVLYILLNNSPKWLGFMLLFFALSEDTESSIIFISSAHVLIHNSPFLTQGPQIENFAFVSLF